MGIGFTIRELKSMAYGRGSQGLSKKEISGIKKYLKSPEAKARIARGKKMARTRKASPQNYAQTYTNQISNIFR
jgi:hypothetical protein